MSEVSRILMAIGAVVAAGGALTAGFLFRVEADLGRERPKPGLQANLHASLESQSASSLFYEVSELLRREYVEPVAVDQRMASGAVRGMVGGLLDSDSVFFDPEQFRRLRAELKGEFEGIGVSLQFRFDENGLEKLREGARDQEAMLLIPDVVVGAVMPGSPAERAGIRAGDEIRGVDGKFVVTGRDIRALRDLQRRVTEKTATTEELTRFRDQLRDRVRENIPASRVRQKLTTGTEGEVSVLVRREGRETRISVPRGRTVVKALTAVGDAVQVRFFDGLSGALASRPLGPSATLDLRQSGPGSFDELLEALPRLVPSGEYGARVGASTGQDRSVTVQNGLAERPRYRLLVDGSTVGAAAVFARLAEAHGLAEIVGGTSMGQARWVELFSLPDGSGFSLATAVYEPEGRRGLSADTPVTEEAK